MTVDRKPKTILARDYGRSVSYFPPPWFKPGTYLPDVHADVWVLPYADRDARVSEHIGDGVFVGYYRGEPFRWSADVAYWSFVEQPCDRPREEP